MIDIKFPNTFNVYRSNWSRGSYNGTFLYKKSTGLKCFIGHFLSGLGFQNEHLDGRQFIGTVITPLEEQLDPVVFSRLKKLGLKIHSQFIYNSNDKLGLSQKEREIILTKKMKYLGYTPIFL